MAKQGLNFQMPITVEGLDISTVEKIEFKFKQREVVRTVLYPSDDVVYDFETGDFKVIWISVSALLRQEHLLSQNRNELQRRKKYETE